jgi:class 3 adenylate cyclase/transcriptional regulator with GAF, ATPase, and Fis domain
MTESTMDELDNMFQLKTLYDVSKELFEAKDTETVLQNFLLTIIGSMGVLEGLIALYDNHSGRILPIIDRGFDKEILGALHLSCARFFGTKDFQDVHSAFFQKNRGEFPEKIKTVIPFGLDKDTRGVLLLGDKISSNSFEEKDIDLLLTLTNHLIIALRNAKFLQQMEHLNRDLQRKNLDLENAFQELDRRVYHLKTLNDISRDIFSTVEFEAIINHFLLMIMGNFGVMQGVVMMTDADAHEITFFKAMGYAEEETSLLKSNTKHLIRQHARDHEVNGHSILVNPEELEPLDICALPFKVTDDCCGVMGLGAKIIGEPFSEDDKELMGTLVNSLVVSLKNALSFENIKQLNQDLLEKNTQLKKALKELKAALRKVELLESIKSNLSKFVPTAVTRLVENASSSEIHEAREQDISVLFLDIEGYTKITDEIGATNVNTLIEKYFSVFMDAIYANDGDVVETAGDGLMVLFLTSEETENALQAVRAAQTIIEKACAINDDCTLDSERCLVNVGVASGKAFVGAAKFESIIGSRWTYTTHGTIVNIAARLCGKAKGGEILLAGETVQRAKDVFQFSSLGKMGLKNLTEDVEVFSLTE